MKKPPVMADCENEATFDAVEDALNDLWQVVNDLSRIRPPKQKYYRVTVFGSARVQRGQPLFDDVKRLASSLSAAGCDIVTGGGPGLMEAANEGENLGDPHNKTRSFGLGVDLPFEEQANPFVEKLYHHRTFFSRLHHFVRLSSAFVVVGGGIGTTLETMIIWQLLQVRHIENIPLILVGPMWKGMVDWASTSMLGHEPPFASARDFKIPTCVDTVDEAVALILAHKASHHEDDTAPEDGSP